MDRKIRLGILFGGKSSEHEVSLLSATSVINAADRSKYDLVLIGITKNNRWLLYEGPVEKIKDGSWEAVAVSDLERDPGHFSFALIGGSGRTLRDLADFILPVIHGPNCEDGTVQGLLKLADIPFGGCGVVGSATAMDKIVAKEIFESAGLRQTPYVAFYKSEDVGEVEKRINESLRYPVFVKPANMGSSVGISKVASPAGLRAAIELAAKYDTRLVAEQGVNAREIETGIMGNDELFHAAVGEIKPAAEADFYDYDAKYFNDHSVMCIPAEISEEKAAEISEMAGRAYKALGCCGFARVDFLMDRDTEEVFINEINTLPGFTHASMFPGLCMNKGLSYPQIIDRIVELGYERYNAENNR